MTNIQDTLRRLDEIDEQYRGDDIILSTNMSLSFPKYTSSSRGIMIGNQLKQCVIPLKTEKPRIFTNYENMVGEHSDYNIVTDANYEVTRIIRKFSKSESDVQPYLVFLRNMDTNEYRVVTRNEIQNLPEKYGFQYNNEGIDSLKEGMIVDAGTTLCRPTSFDEYGNWGFGKNVPFVYEINDYTIEDAVTVSETLAKEFQSIEAELVKIPINENNFLLNIYGDDTENNYKVIPDIGEDIENNRVCIKRTIYKSQLLFDMTNANTRRRLDGDTVYYSGGGGTIVDIDIYCNKPMEEIPDTVYNQQILKYLYMSREYWKNVQEYTQQLIDDGEHVSVEIKALNKRAKELLDPDVIVKDENNSAFSYITMYVLVKRRTGLKLGQKVTGRHGNKGVISRIVPDYEMYHIVETGETVHITFNTLGIIGRLNIFQIFEQAMTFILDKVLMKINGCDKMKEKEFYLFRVLEIFNPVYCEWVKNDYMENCKTKKEKEFYFELLKKNGIYLHIPAYWMERSVYECIKQCFDEFDFLQLYTTVFYDTVSERWVPTINKQIVGSMYIMKQKQSSEKGLIVRSTGSVSRLGIPCKSDSAKKHLLPYSQQPIRYGEQEYVNQLISLDAETIAKKAVFVRTSPIGRKVFGKKLFQYPLGIDDIEITGNMTNQAVSILNCYMLIMGRQLVFEYDVLNLDETNPNAIKEHLFQNRLYYCTTDEIKEIVARYYGKLKIEDNEEGYILLGTEADLEEFLDEIVAETKETIVDQLEY